MTRSRARIVLPSLVSAAIAAASAAQGRWITVDAQNRPGTDFTDFPPAVAAAADGDTIRVRSATTAYSSTTVTKALTVLGEPGTVFVPGLVIADLRPGQQCAVKGVTLQHSFALGITVTNCTGRVFLDRITAPAAPAGNRSLYIVDSANVLVGNCSLGGGIDVQLAQDVVFQRTSASAREAFRSGSGWYNGAPAITANYATLTIAGGTWTGGFGWLVAGGSGCFAANSAVTIAGDASTVFTAGGSFGASESAIALDSASSLRIDPTVRLQPAAGAPPVRGTGTVTMFRMPALTGSGAPPGGQVVLDLFAPSGDLFGLYLGLPGMPLAFPPFRGTIWTDLATTVELTRGVLDASEHFVLTATVPAVPALQGKVFVAHGLTGLPARGFLLSNPTALVVD